LATCPNYRKPRLLDDTPHSTAFPLDERCLLVQDLQCLLQAFNFSRTALGAFLEGLGLCNATVLDFLIVLHHSSQFSARSFFVPGKLGDFLVETLEFLSLVLNILTQSRLGDFVLLCGGLVLLGRIRFGSLLCCQILREIAFANLKNADDTATSS